MAIMKSRAKKTIIDKIFLINYYPCLLDIDLSKFWETVGDREAWLAAVHRAAKSWMQLRD